MFLHAFLSTFVAFLRPYGITAFIPWWHTHNDPYLDGRYRIMFCDGSANCSLFAHRHKNLIVPVLTNIRLFIDHEIPLDFQKVSGDDYTRLLILGEKKYRLRCRRTPPELEVDSAHASLMIEGNEQLLFRRSLHRKSPMWNIHFEPL